MSEPSDIDNDEEEFAESTLIQAIENQIESDNPPAAKATFNKLTLVGYEREEILNLMAHVLAVEIDAILEEDRAFDTQWYEAALRALPDRYRTVVFLADLQGLAYQQISTVTGIPIGSVKSCLHRARERLRAELGSYASHG